MNDILRNIVMLFVGATLIAGAFADEPNAKPDTPPTQAPAEEPVAAHPEQSPQAAPQPAGKEIALPGLRVDREKRIVDLEATVVLRQGDWLELLACTPGTREHEAILTVPARPSHVNLALIMIGLEPGSPMRTEQVDEKFVTMPPKGPKVAVHIVYKVDGKEKEIPANAWIYDRHTQKPMAGNHWLFTGSRMFEHEGKSMFLADINGTVLSLVNFGDDLLVRDTALTSQNDGEILAAHTEAIPEVGTKVIIRLRPVVEKPKEE